MLILELIGTVSFALSGAVVGVSKKADVFGVIFLAIVTALGGGVIRDMMLGYLPPRMFTAYIYILLAVLSALAVFLDAYFEKEKAVGHWAKIDQLVNVLDAAGLAVFTVSGMDMAIESCGMEMPVLLVALGMITGTGGGVLRDVLTNEMPMVLKKRVYAVASMAGAILYYLLLVLGVDKMFSGVSSEEPFMTTLRAPSCFQAMLTCAPG